MTSKEAEVSSTVKSNEGAEDEDDDCEVLRINYKDLPDDYFDSLIEVENWDDEKLPVDAAGKTSVTTTAQKKSVRTSPPKEKVTTSAPKKELTTAPKKRELITAPKKESTEERGRSPTKRKNKSPEKEQSPKAKRSKSVSRRKSKSPSRNKSRSPSRKRSKSPARKRSKSPQKRKSRSKSPRRRSKSPKRRSRSPRRPSRRSISPLRRPMPAPRRSPVRRRSPSPGRRRGSPRRSRSPRRTGRRSRSPTELFTARMSSRRSRQLRSGSRERVSTSLSPEQGDSRVKEPMRTGAGRYPPPHIRSRSPPRIRSRSPPSGYGKPTTSGPSLEEIANGSAVPYGYPYQQPMVYYPPGGFPPPGPIGYPAYGGPMPGGPMPGGPMPVGMMPGGPMPPAGHIPPGHPMPLYPQQPMVPGDQSPYVGPSSQHSGSLPPESRPSMEPVQYPLPVPRPPDMNARASDYNPVLPPKPAPVSKTQAPSRKRNESVASKDSEDSMSAPSSGLGGSMKLSEYLASMTASHRPMEYSRAVDDRIKNAISKFDETFLQPLRFSMTQTATEPELEKSATNAFTSPLLKQPVVKMANFIRPLNLRALKLPERPQFVCRRPELPAAKPEISIKELLAKRAALAPTPQRRDMGTSPMIVTRGIEISCQTDPEPPPICSDCEERSRKRYINHWTQVKRTETCEMETQTMPPPTPAAPIALRLGDYVDESPRVPDGRAQWNFADDRARQASPLPFMINNRPRSRSPVQSRFHPGGAERYSPSQQYSPAASPPLHFNRISPSPPRHFQPEISPPRHYRHSPSPPRQYERALSPTLRRGTSSPRQWFNCVPCDIMLNSEQQLHDHQLSRRHMLRMEHLEAESRNRSPPPDQGRNRDIRDNRQMYDRRTQRSANFARGNGAHRSWK